MYAIDTAETIKKLTAADMPEAQARVIVDTLKLKYSNSELATKTDTRELRQGLKADIAKLQIGQTWLQWAAGSNLVLTLLIFSKLLFF